MLLGIRWIDRWEPEPRSGLIFAFLWGAGVSVLLALIVDFGVSEQIAAGGGATNGTIFAQTVFQAPIVEEFGKGLGVLLIFIVGRRFFDGPVDGIVYAATVASGFAFTENIQYFGLQVAEAGGLDGTVGEIFIVRGLLSPFAHVMFTAATGSLHRPGGAQGQHPALDRGVPGRADPRDPAAHVLERCTVLRRATSTATTSWCRCRCSLWRCWGVPAATP